MKKASYKHITSLSRWIMVTGLFTIYCSFGMGEATAQQYLGTNGLIHVPTAEMDSAGIARIGAHYVEKHMIPDGLKLRPEGTKFNSMTNYLSITPFRWIEMGYGYTLWKFHYNNNTSGQTGFYSKDRYFSLRLNLLYETAILPSVVVGGNDVWGSNDEGLSASNFYRNYYLAVSKHFDLNGHTIGAHAAYRRWYRDYNKKWNGPVGGLTYRPAFLRPLRLIGEYDGDGVNIGADCLLFRHILIQTSLQKCKYFSAGLCFQLQLL